MGEPRRLTPSPGRGRQRTGGLRIIAGTWKGRRISAPPGLETRPLTDRIKQSLFDWLGDLQGARVADVCSGSGSFAFEAASRGAAEVYAIECSPAAFTVLTENHRALGSPTSVRLRRADLRHILPTLSGLDLVFADPPFPWFVERTDDLRTLLVMAQAAVRAEGSVVLRGERGQAAPPIPGLHEVEHRPYGRSWVARYLPTRIT